MSKQQTDSDSSVAGRPAIPRSPLLMDRRVTGLLLVDLQSRLVPLIPGHEKLVWNCSRLVRAAEAFAIPVVGTEQYPEKLGPTVPSLVDSLTKVQGKRDFSCGACPELFSEFATQGRSTLLVIGIETHVCVMQTVLDLLADGFDIHIAVDAIGARNEIDHSTAMRRMDLAGATLTTTETAIFEWCETSTAAEFKQISALIRESPTKLTNG